MCGGRDAYGPLKMYPTLHLPAKMNASLLKYQWSVKHLFSEMHGSLRSNR